MRFEVAVCVRIPVGRVLNKYSRNLKGKQNVFFGGERWIRNCDKFDCDDKKPNKKNELF